MNYAAIVQYFEAQGKSGEWDSLYNPSNPLSYPFIIRFKKTTELMNNLQGKTILDMGCGSGILIPFVLDNKANFIGLDISQNMLDFIGNKYPSLVKSGQVALEFGDIRDYKFPSSPVHVMVGMGFIEYFEKPEEVIALLYKNLPEGGQLVLTFPNFDSLDYLLLRALEPVRFLLRKLTGKGTHQPPRKLWNSKYAIQLFKDSGFKNIQQVNYNVNIFTYPFTKINQRFTNLFAKIFEYGFLSKFDFFASGFIISGNK